VQAESGSPPSPHCTARWRPGAAEAPHGGTRAPDPDDIKTLGVKTDDAAVLDKTTTFDEETRERKSEESFHGDLRF
jgi:hypothetical protein